MRGENKIKRTGGRGGGGRAGDSLSPWSTCPGRSGCDPGLTKSWRPQEGRQSLHVGATGEKDCTGVWVLGEAGTAGSVSFLVICLT